MDKEISPLSPITQSPYSKGFVMGFIILIVIVGVLTAWRFFIKRDYYITKNPTVIERVADETKNN